MTEATEKAYGYILNWRREPERVRIKARKDGKVRAIELKGDGSDSSYSSIHEPGDVFPTARAALERRLANAQARAHALEQEIYKVEMALAELKDPQEP